MVEMHHVRLLKDLNPNMSEIDRLMSKRRRKKKNSTMSIMSLKSSQNFNNIEIKIWLRLSRKR